MISLTNSLNDHVVNVDGSASYGHSTNLGEDINFKPSGSGFGFDLGAKYSFKNQYIFGVSLLDVGSIKFDRNVEVQNFTMTQQNWDLDLENIDNIADFDLIVAARGILQSSPNEFKVGLPTTFSLQATANLWESGDFEGGGYQNLLPQRYHLPRPQQPQQQQRSHHETRANGIRNGGFCNRLPLARVFPSPLATPPACK